MHRLLQPFRIQRAFRALRMCFIAPATALALGAHAQPAAVPSLAIAAYPAAPASIAPAASGSAVPDYRLGAGDAVRIVVYQSPDLSLEARLTESGTISYPLLGQLKLGGLTTTQAEKVITDGLVQKDQLKNPQVTLTVTDVRGNQVSVLGQVVKAGRYALVSSQTRLSDVLAQAGGILPSTVASYGGADVVTLTGTRDGKPYRTQIDLPQLYAASGGGADVLLQHNDVVWVDRAPRLYIYGEVQKPGALRLERDMTVMQALAAGGGLTARGTDKGIRVHRRGADGKTAVLQPTMDEPLRDGDVVYVRESLF